MQKKKHMGSQKREGEGVKIIILMSLCHKKFWKMTFQAKTVNVSDGGINLLTDRHSELYDQRRCLKKWLNKLNVNRKSVCCTGKLYVKSLMLVDCITQFQNNRYLKNPLQTRRLFFLTIFVGLRGVRLTTGTVYRHLWYKKSFDLRHTKSHLRTKLKY